MITAGFALAITPLLRLAAAARIGSSANSDFGTTD